MIFLLYRGETDESPIPVRVDGEEKADRWEEEYRDHGFDVVRVQDADAHKFPETRGV